VTLGRLAKLCTGNSCAAALIGGKIQIVLTGIVKYGGQVHGDMFGGIHGSQNYTRIKPCPVTKLFCDVCKIKRMKDKAITTRKQRPPRTS